jgi:hypothetical protein
VRHRCRRRRLCRTSSTGAPPPLRGTTTSPALVTSMSPWCCGESPPSSSCSVPPRYHPHGLYTGHATPLRLSHRWTPRRRWRGARGDQLQRAHGAPRKQAGQATLVVCWATPSRLPRPFGPGARQAVGPRGAIASGWRSPFLFTVFEFQYSLNTSEIIPNF